MNRAERRRLAKQQKKTGRAITTPSHQEALRLFQSGLLNEATQICVDALAVNNGDADALSLLAHIYYRQGDASSAINFMQRSLQHPPGQTDNACTLAIWMQERGNLEQAEIFYKQALKLKPDFAAACSNYGTLLHLQGRLEEAVSMFRRALKIQPDFSDAWSNLAILCTETGQIPEALAAYRSVLKLMPRDLQKRAVYVQTLFNANLDDLSPDDRTHIQKCFHVTGMDWRLLAKPWFHLLKTTSAWKILQQYRTGEEAAEPLPLKILTGLGDDYLCDGLSRLITPYRDFEDYLIGIRKHLLCIAVTPDTTGEENSLLTRKPVSRFLCALAQQCFLNEYVNGHTEEESNQLDTLKNQLEELLQTATVSGEINPSQLSSLQRAQITLFACYIPLYQLKNSAALLDMSRTPEKKDSKEINRTNWEGVLDTQIRQPLEEDRLKTNIPVIGNITNNVSRDVRAHYEEHPYPRWISVGCGRTGTVRNRLTYLFPHLANNPNVPDPENPDILVAGCGTGKHAIEIATEYRSSNVLAVDLSLSSLAYALRKTSELGITNVTFRQADILELNALNQRFDLIESVGVLHHMSEPLTGWRVLVSLLKPGAFMKVALYSETARKSVVAAREFIAEQGFSHTEEGIRRCRQALIKLPDGHPAKPVTTQYLDFYTLSQCRDLIFHQQEHRFNLLEIAEMVEKLGLVFIGLETDSPTVQQHYRQEFPGDPEMNSLLNWHEYEQRHPNTFLSMYQCWLQKQS